MKKILLSLMTLVLVLGLVGAGAFAYFSDTETSSNNTFTAGTMDLEITAGPGTGTSSVTFDNMQPGGPLAEGEMTVKNVGSLDGDLYGKTTYTQTHSSPPDADLGQVLMVTLWDEDGTDIPTNMTLAAFCSQGWQLYGTLTQGSEFIFGMGVELPTTVGNDYQGDGVVVTFDLALVQVGQTPA